MILGIGTDIIEIRRIERVLDRFSPRFLLRVFTQEERIQARERSTDRQPAFYAKRFAAKEACLKALGTGLSHGISWQDISVSNTISGCPFITLSGAAWAALLERVPAGFAPKTHLSLSDSAIYAQAFVVISALIP